MEPASGGVKSMKILTPHLLAALTGACLRRPRISVYIRFMRRDTPHTRYFRFLRLLRAGGRTNMYGAVPYLMKAFDLDRGTAFSVVCAWLDQQSDLQEVEPEKPIRRRRLSSVSQS
jgi:hypothetical protein